MLTKHHYLNSVMLDWKLSFSHGNKSTLNKPINTKYDTVFLSVANHFAVCLYCRRGG